MSAGRPLFSPLALSAMLHLGAVVVAVAALRGHAPPRAVAVWQEAELRMRPDSHEQTRGSIAAPAGRPTESEFRAVRAVDDARSEYAGAVRTRISERLLRLPPGTWTVDLAVDANGEIATLAVSPTSGIIEQAIHDAAPFAPPRPQWLQAGQLQLRLPVQILER